MNRFALEALPSTSPYKDLIFGDVRVEERKAFFGYEICVRFLYTDDVREVEDVFKRLK